MKFFRSNKCIPNAVSTKVSVNGGQRGVSKLDLVKIEATKAASMGPLHQRSAIFGVPHIRTIFKFIHVSISAYFESLMHYLNIIVFKHQHHSNIFMPICPIKIFSSSRQICGLSRRIKSLVTVKYRTRKNCIGFFSMSLTTSLPYYLLVKSVNFKF